MTAPQRIQLRRTKGWRKPEGTIVVARPGRWGNPWRIGDGYQAIVEEQCDAATNNGRVIGGPQLMVSAFVETPDIAVALYRLWIVTFEDEVRAQLAGHDLACWCRPDQPCHGDVLLEIANAS